MALVKKSAAESHGFPSPSCSFALESCLQASANTQNILPSKQKRRPCVHLETVFGRRFRSETRFLKSVFE